MRLQKRQVLKYVLNDGEPSVSIGAGKASSIFLNRLAWCRHRAVTASGQCNVLRSTNVAAQAAKIMGGLKIRSQTQEWIDDK